MYIYIYTCISICTYMCIYDLLDKLSLSLYIYTYISVCTYMYISDLLDKLALILSLFPIQPIAFGISFLHSQISI